MGSLPESSVADVKNLDFTVMDIRFPTSLDGVGSDAMHVGTNGSHPYIQLHTNHPDLIGEGIVRNSDRGQIPGKLLTASLVTGFQQRSR